MSDTNGGDKPPSQGNGPAKPPGGSSPPAPGGDELENPLRIKVSQSILDELERGLSLLDYAIESGAKKEEGRTLSADVVRDIKDFAAKVLGLKDKPHIDVAHEDWVKFELAYYNLAQFMNPVTAETLAISTIRREGKPSGAQRFTRRIWVIALGFALFAILSEWGMVVFSPILEGEAGFWNGLMQVVQILNPFMYGGLGACVYLLRQAHKFIHERSFDIQREPEYFNRVILGTIAGGAIVLLINQITDEGGLTIELSEAALGFLAGYSTDFLYNTIERVIAAIMPKTGIESVRRARPIERSALNVDVGELTLAQLLDRHEKAGSDEDKDLYKSLIEKLRDRL